MMLGMQENVLCKLPAYRKSTQILQYCDLRSREEKGFKFCETKLKLSTQKNKKPKHYVMTRGTFPELFFLPFSENNALPFFQLAQKVHVA